MTQLSENFSRSEFACNCGCGEDTVDAELINILQAFRKEINRKVTILSGCRCEKHNAEEGGKQNSMHLRGRAADIRVEGMVAKDVTQWFLNKFPGKYGIGSYATFTHFDTRTNGPARW